MTYGREPTKSFTVRAYISAFTDVLSLVHVVCLCVCVGIFRRSAFPAACNPIGFHYITSTGNTIVSARSLVIKMSTWPLTTRGAPTGDAWRGANHCSMTSDRWLGRPYYPLGISPQHNPDVRVYTDWATGRPPAWWTAAMFIAGERRDNDL